MVYRWRNRIILLALLPVVALILYHEGQKYDPALITFTPSDIRTGIEANLFPREIDGFSRTGQVRVFSKENLYEYVNGHAEYFMSAGFVRLAVGEYVQIGTEPSQPDVVVDIYDMGKDIHALGVLTDEVGDDPSPLKDGIVGAITAQGISFVSGRYYVKIAAFRDTVPVQSFAADINVTLGSSSREIAEFSRLPIIGEVVTTRFVKEAYRGLDFVNNVVEREYRVQNVRVQISLIIGSDEELKKLIASYLTFFQESDTTYTLITQRGQVLYKVMDPYEGDWYLIPLADALFGIYGVSDEVMLDQFISSIMDLIEGKPG